MTKSIVINVLKSALFYGVLFILTAYGNSFGVVRYSVLWIGTIALISGLIHRDKLERGIYFYLIPQATLLTVTLFINYQVFWAFELLIVISGFFLGNQVNKPRVWIVLLSILSISFSLIESFKYAQYDFDKNHFVQTKQTEILKSSNTESEFTLVQFTSENCGQCLKQIDFIDKFLEQNSYQFNLIGVYLPSKRGVEEGEKKFKKLKDKGLTIINDTDGKICHELGVTYFPVILILDRKGVVLHRINGFNGDMQFVYEENLKKFLIGN